MGPLFRNLEQLVDFYCKNKLDLPCVLRMSLNKSKFRPLVNIHVAIFKTVFFFQKEK
jgi:hypothetical protein